MSYEYKVVPAPTRGLKAKGIKTPEDRFANALETAMNDLAADGWEYLRTDTLPSEQREGFMGKTTVYQNMLVFRRSTEAATVVLPTAEAPAAPVTPSEPPVTAARRRSGPHVSRPLPAPERLTPELKEELRTVEIAAKPSKTDVAAE